MQPFWIWRSDATKTHTIYAQRVTPFVQSIGLRVGHGGWLWQFPIAVEVEDSRTGDRQRLPIHDTTRTTLWWLYALILLVVAVRATSWWHGKDSDKSNRKV